MGNTISSIILKNLFSLNFIFWSYYRKLIQWIRKNHFFHISFRYFYSCASISECTWKHVVLNKGVYKIECWGAQGGRGLNNTEIKYPGGKGAYTSGIIYLSERTPLYLYIGQKGSDGMHNTTYRAPGGWNGGGNGGADIQDNDGPGGGGGATDVRLTPGDWNNTESLRSRIMVAAGGSGGAYRTYGGPGGDLNGYVTRQYDLEIYQKSSTSQTSGNAFGIGANGNDFDFTPDSGGGGGYYGGNIGNSAESKDAGYNSVSSSGSSYISGYQGCDSLSIDGEHTGSPIHYSGLVFNKPEMKNGFTEFPSPKRGVNEVGHEGNGAVVITKLSLCTKDYSKKMNSKTVALSLISVLLH